MWRSLKRWWRRHVTGDFWTVRLLTWPYVQSYAYCPYNSAKIKSYWLSMTILGQYKTREEAQKAADALNEEHDARM
jgi:hypothetical protein